MGRQAVKSREELQFLYELAFFPPRLGEFWTRIKRGEIDREVASAAIRGALLLHLALPESGYASVRALQRLAHYQASSKPFVPVTTLTNMAKKMNLDVTPTVAHVPPEMVRDVGLPPFGRTRPGHVPRVAESR